MNVTKKSFTRYTLSDLSEENMVYLRSLLQNDLTGGESKVQAEHRKQMFNAIDLALTTEPVHSD